MNGNIIKRIQTYTMLGLALIGLLSLFVSVSAPWLGIDLTQGFGALQVFIFMVGLTCLTVAGFLFLNYLRPDDAPRSLQADIGVRLAATGLVFAYVAGFADLLGIGTHPHTNYPRPFLGWLQILGVLLGLFSIVAGMLLYYTSRGNRPSSSLQFLLNNEDETTDTTDGEQKEVEVPAG